jgi:hypothetical protein
VNRPASEAAIGRLHEATGRPVLTAATEGQNASELGKLGHGIFTYALLDALHHAGTEGNGNIRVSDLAAYVQDRVPQVVAGAEGRSAIPRGAAGGGQSAYFGAPGSDFALVGYNSRPLGVHPRACNAFPLQICGVRHGYSG